MKKLNFYGKVNIFFNFDSHYTNNLHILMKLEEAIKSDAFRGARHKAVLNILYSAYWLKNNSSTLLKTYNVTIEQYNVLHTLSLRHPEQVCVKDIATRMLEKSSNVPRIIDRLVEKGLATRSTSQSDKRETIVSITPKGMEVHDASMKGIDHQREELMSLTDEEAAQLSELLDKMRAMSEPSTPSVSPYYEADVSYSEK
jgi:DNA-binding MarR family transcriptional regulator